MDQQFAAEIFFYVILYGTLGIIAIPVIFFLLWTFFSFFKHHIVIFYFVLCSLYAGSVAGFYLTRQYWFYKWYYPFPAWIQILGLLLMALAALVVMIAQRQITLRVRLFLPLLKGERFKLRTDGIFRFLRHPIYSVIPLAILGALFYTGELIIIVPLIFNLLTRSWYASREEEQLKHLAIGDYDEYRKRTPYRFYPKLFIKGLS